MLKIVDITVNYQNKFLELFNQVKTRFLRRCTRMAILYSVQWISVMIVSFLLIYSAGSLALYIPFSYASGPTRSDIHAKYGEWAISHISRVGPDIIEEIKRDNPQNSIVHTDPIEDSPYRDPFVIGQVGSGNIEPPIIDTDPPGIVVSKPTNTKLPDLPRTMTPVVTDPQKSQPTLSPSQTTSPTQVIYPTNTPYSPTATLPPTNTSIPPSPTSLHTSTSAPPVPTEPPTSTSAPPVPTVPPTSTSVPPTPTALPTSTSVAPTPTDQPWVLICHISQLEWIPPITILIPQEWVEWHLAHGDYLGECTSP
jgi:hypothetical protein